MASGTWESRADRIATVVARVRMRMVAVALAAGLLLAIAAAIAWVVGGLLLDLAAPLSVPLRVVAWSGWWAVVAAGGGAFVLLPALRRPLLDTVSLRIERALGGIHNRLLTVVDLARGNRARHDLEPDMVEQLLDQTQQSLAGFRPSRVVRWQALARNAALAIGALALVFALYLTLGERLIVTLQRLLHPTADIPPATWLQLRSPGDVAVLEGEPLEIEARVVRSSVDAVELVIFDTAGRALRHPMRSSSAGSFIAQLDGLDHAATYRLEGGGTWTKTHAITLLHRPEIGAITRQIRLPDFMRIDAAIPVADDARRIEALEGSTVEFIADVSEDAVEGSLQISERTLENRDVERYDERIWFEDDLPRDAVAETPWKWTTTHAAGGLRSFTFGFEGMPFGMRTRLEPLVLPRDLLPQRAVMLMARLDPVDPPGRLAMLLECDDSRMELVWGDAAAVAPAKGVLRFVAGPLPPPGEWVRLTAELKDLPQLKLVGRIMTAVTFSVDRGRVLLDRPGWVDRTTQSVQQPVDRPIEPIPVRRLAKSETESHVRSIASSEPATGSVTGLVATQTWIGGVPVEKPVWASIEFRSAAGHPSLPVPAVEIAPTIDRPPSIVVEQPPALLSLRIADDVEIQGRVFDDWGLDSIAVRIGPDAEHLAPPVPLAGVTLADRPPDTQVVLSTVLSAEQLGLAPGKTVAWSLVARDTKGQITETKAFRVTVVLPPEMALARTQVPALEQARREAEQAARSAEQQAAAIDEKREAVMKAVGEQPLEAIEAAEQAQQQAKASSPPEGKPDPELAKAAEEKTAAAQQSADMAAQALEPPRKNDLAAVDGQLEQQSREAERLAKSIAQAADQAAQSPLVPQPQKDQLAALAAEAEALKESLARNEAFKGDTAKLDRLADAPPPSAVAETARRLEQSLKDVEQQLDATGAARRLKSLSQDLERRSQSLTAMAEQQANSPQAAAQKQADNASKPEPPSDTQSEPLPAENKQKQQQDRAAERVAREQIQQVEQILGQPVAAMMKPDAAKPDAAKPDAAKPDAAKPDAAKPDAAKPDAAKPESAGEAGSPAESALREPLTAAVEAAAEAASMTGRTVAALAEQLTSRRPLPPQQAASEPASPSAGKPATPASADPPGTTPPQPGTPAPEKAGAAPGEMAAESSVAALEALLESSDVQQALQMAERARRLQERAAREAARQAAAGKGAPAPPGPGQGQMPGEPSDIRQPGEPMAQPTDGGAMAGQTEVADPLRGLDASRRAAIYKLPPRVRDPLLEGMRQRGPAAYQDVIDTYFRQLGRDIPQ